MPADPLNPRAMHTRKMYIRILLAAALTAPAASAQVAPAAKPPADSEAVQLSVFEVTTTKDIGYQSSNAAEVTRMDTPISDIPMNVTIFNQQFIDDILAKDTTDVLDYDAGIRKTSENDQFLARGFSSVSANSLNGFSQPAGFGSQSVANVERIEIIKGPAAVLYGQGGYGATVNRVTKKPLPTPRTMARAIYGSNDSLRLSLDNTGPLPVLGGKRLLYRLNLEWEDTETYRGTESKRFNISPSLAWNITEKSQVVFEYLYDRHVRPGGWAYPMRAGDPNGIVTGDGAYLSFGDRDVNHTADDDIRQNTRQVASVDVRHAFTRDIQFRGQFQYSDRDQHQVEIQPDINALTILKDAVLMPRSWRDVPRGTENFRTRSELVAKLKTGPVHHRLLLGHAWDEQIDENKTSRSVKNYGGLAPGSAALEGDGRHAPTGLVFNSFPTFTLAQFIANPKLAGFNPNLLLPVNVFDPANSPALPPPAQRAALWLDTWTHNKLANREFYFSDLMSLAGERVFWQIGARRTETSRATLNRMSGAFPFKVLNPNARKNFASADATTYSTGAVWHLMADKALSLYANLNSSFSPEFRTQLDGSPLDPEEGNQREAGLKFSLREGRLQGLVTYFDIRMENVTQADPLNPGYFVQLQGQRSTGWEANLNLRLTDSWTAFGGYAYIDARDERTGLSQSRQAEHSFTLFNRYLFQSGKLKGAFASLGSIYVGERLSDRTNTNRREPTWVAPSFWRFDAIVGYKLPAAEGRRVRYEFALKVKNVLDKKNMFFVITPDRWTADPGREWDLTLTARF